MKVYRLRTKNSSSKKHKFKPGDKVRIVSLEAPTREYFKEEFPTVNNVDYSDTVSRKDVVTIASIYHHPEENEVTIYKIIEDDGFFDWKEDWLKPVQNKLSSFLNNINKPNKLEVDTGG